MTTIAHRIQHIYTRIQLAAQQHQRCATNITLLAVSKTKTIDNIQQAILAGQNCFGENYVQEAIDKIDYFNATKPDNTLEWHLIGHLQSNKTRIVAEYFDWVQTVDSIKIAQRLSAQRPAYKPALNILIQINISQEASKSGILPHQLPVLAAQLVPLTQITLRCIMTIPSIDKKQHEQQFKQMKQLFAQLSSEYPTVDTLSMGMSEDLEHAIAYGSTMVRVGSAIFGERTTKTN